MTEFIKVTFPNNALRVDIIITGILHMSGYGMCLAMTPNFVDNVEH